MALTRRHHSDDVLANCRHVVYLKGTTGHFWANRIYPFFEFLNVKWYTMFFVLLFGLYVIVRFCVSCHLAHVYCQTRKCRVMH